MNQNESGYDLTKKIIKLVEQNNRGEIFQILCSELKTVRLSREDVISYCTCGYPLSYIVEEIDHKNESTFSYKLLKEILREDADFDHFRLEYYCPKCGTFLEEIQC